MKIFTSYYANIKNIPEDYTLISISGGITDDILKAIDIHDKSLAPSWSIYKEYKDSPDTEKYTERFQAEILPKVNLNYKLQEWQEISNNINKSDTFVLLCYETPNDFCHRHLVAEAFKEIGVTATEYKKPNESSVFDDF